MLAMAVVTCGVDARRRPASRRRLGRRREARATLSGACRAAPGSCSGAPPSTSSSTCSSSSRSPSPASYGARRRDRPLLRLPVRELPGGRHRHGARDVAHPRHDARRARRAPRGRRRHRPAGLPLRDAARRAGAGRADRRRRAAHRTRSSRTASTPAQVSHAAGRSPRCWRRGRSAALLVNFLLPGAVRARPRPAASTLLALPLLAAARRRDRDRQRAVRRRRRGRARCSWPRPASPRVLLVAGAGREAPAAWRASWRGDARALPRARRARLRRRRGGRLALAPRARRGRWRPSPSAASLYVGRLALRRAAAGHGPAAACVARPAPA